MEGATVAEEHRDAPQPAAAPPAVGAAPQPPPPAAATGVPVPISSGAAGKPPHSRVMHTRRPLSPRTAAAGPTAGTAAAAPLAAAGAVTKRAGRKGGRRTANTAPAGLPQPEDLVKLGPEISRSSERLRTGWRPVVLSSEDKASELALDDKQLTASSTSGYRMARATHGAFQGTWYFEVQMDHLGPSGAARVGWCTRQAELNAPVGADEHGFSYRSTQGSRVHAGWREDYGSAYGGGDVVGCLLHLPDGGRPFEQGAADVVKHKGKLYLPEVPQTEPQKLPGSYVAFSLNGKMQGKSYLGDLKEGTYCPAVSLYTNRTQQRGPASLTVNFGERGFAFPPPPVAEGCPPPRPVCELPGPRPVAAAPQHQEQQQQQRQESLQQQNEQQQPQQQQPDQQQLASQQQLTQAPQEQPPAGGQQPQQPQHAKRKRAAETTCFAYADGGSGGGQAAAAAGQFPAAQFDDDDESMDVEISH